VTAPTTERLPVRVPGRTLPPRLIHATCLVCLNEVTFCGIDAAGLSPVRPKPTEPTCIVCRDLRKAHGWDRCLEVGP
jgi:hypothetical protein